MPFTFDHQKATQALTFLATRSNGWELNKMKALKLVFFADRFHLRKYGRPITGDAYVAMKYGPVASNTKDIAEKSDFLDAEERDYAADFVEPIDQWSFRAIAEPDLSLLSESDVEALSWAWDRFATMDKYALSEYTHRYPEWKKWQQALQKNTRMQMDYADFLEEPVDAEPCYALTEQKRAAMLEGLQETAAFEARW